jgi:tRNA 2-selenouridine synthase
MHGHIPGAINFPLLDNEERAKVGTCYKEKGNYAAVLMGYELVGHKFQEYIKNAAALSPAKAVNIHCYRGGLRSTIMANLLVSAGFEVNLLSGGYKAYRKRVHEILEQPRRIVVIGGLTGAGKTELLLKLKAAGEQVVDLEALAKHRGSSFGAIGQ